MNTEIQCTSSLPTPRACIHQPDYLPWLGFFHKVALSELYIVFDDCEFSKPSWTNRVRIAVEGEAKWLTVPVYFRGKSSQLIKDVRINSSTTWEKKHFETIRQNYQKAPFFSELFELLEPTYQKKFDFLIDLNMHFIRTMFSVLELNPSIVFSSELGCQDFRATERLIQLLSRSGSATYVCGMGSGGYLEPELFAKASIELAYQQFDQWEYPQIKSKDWIPGLSIIDAVANCGVEAISREIQRHCNESALKAFSRVGE